MNELYILFDSNDGGRVLERFEYSSENELDRLVDKKLEELRKNYFDNAWIIFNHYHCLAEIPHDLRKLKLSVVYDRMTKKKRKSDKQNLKNSFNYKEWLREFEEASQKNRGHRPERKKIFENTVDLVQSGMYWVEGQLIEIDNKSIFSQFFSAVERINTKRKFNTKFSVINADCLETAKLLAESGMDPCVLNLANRHNPGGGVIIGSGAQEENLFRRTNLFTSMYQFTDYAKEYGIKKSRFSYPLDKTSGGIYTGSATVFRGSEANGYCLLRKPFELSFVSVAALNRPILVKRDNLFYLKDKDIEFTKNRIRTILRIAGKYKHDSLVLGAFGCGAFKNPPNHIAKIFKEVFLEDEFHNAFKLVVFSIIEDRNSWMEHNPEGNVLPFLKVFDGFKTTINE